MPPETDTLTLGLMTKYWDVGQVKTRLGVSVGMRRAALLHQLFVSYLCESLAEAGGRNIACLAPDHCLGQFQLDLQSWGLEECWDAMPQGGGSLGQRIERWFIHSLDSGSSHQSPRSILIGADCPTLQADQIQLAGELLRTRDAVLGPAGDGGYYLVGLRGPWSLQRCAFESLFRDIPWSTDKVLSITRWRLESSGLSFAELETREDVDTAAELNRLRESIAAAGDQHAKLKLEIDRILTDESLSDPKLQ